MNETKKAILVVTFMIVAIVAAIITVEAPKPSKLSANIAQQIIINIEEK